MSAWFTLNDLQNLFPYNRVQNATTTFVDNVLIPEAQDFVQNYTGISWTDPPDDILRVAQNYSVNKILADDENVRIAVARGQPSFIVAGDTVTLDLSPGQNPLLSTEDQVILDRYRALTDQTLHVDKVTVKSEGAYYRQSRGRNRVNNTDYITEDNVPRYFSGQ